MTKTAPLTATILAQPRTMRGAGTMAFPLTLTQALFPGERAILSPLHAIFTVLTLILALLAPSAQADEVTDQLAAAGTAYTAGELRSAIQALNFASAKIQEQINDRLLKLLPEPLTGWEADAPESEAGGVAAMVVGTMLSRTYHRPDGAEVELRLMADSPMLGMMTMMMQTPFLMQASNEMRVYTNRGHQGMIQHEDGSDSWEISLMIGSRILIQAKGSGIADQQEVQAYLDAIDLTAVEQALTK